MSALPGLAGLEGEWVGPNTLWLSPDDPARVSDGSATIASAAQGRFVTCRYSWADKGEPQDGLLVIGFEPSSGLVTAFWLDSWHMGDKVMRCEGALSEDGAVEVAGSYAAPPGPDWGWTIRLELADDTLRLLMHNVTPEGQSAPAVEAVFTRVFR